MFQSRSFSEGGGGRANIWISTFFSEKYQEEDSDAMMKIFCFERFLRCINFLHLMKWKIDVEGAYEHFVFENSKNNALPFFQKKYWYYNVKNKTRIPYTPPTCFFFRSLGEGRKIWCVPYLVESYCVYWIMKYTEDCGGNCFVLCFQNIIKKIHQILGKSKDSSKYN